MKSARSAKLRSITYTSGSNLELPEEYDVLKIRGSVSVLSAVRLNRISTHGYGLFRSQVTVEELHSSGACVLEDCCQAKQLLNNGSLKLDTGHITSVVSSGNLTIKYLLKTEDLSAIGMIHGKEIHAKQCLLKLSSESKIERLVTEKAQISKDKKSLSLLKKRLLCEYIKGQQLYLSYTHADIVEGDTVIIDKNCSIHTLYYTEDYRISPKSEVHQVIRREK